MSRVGELKLWGCLVVCAAVGGLVGSAAADMSDVIFRIEVSNLAGEASFEVDVSQGSWKAMPNYDTMPGHSVQPVWEWRLQHSLGIRDAEGDLIATLDGGGIELMADPQVNLNFALTAGSSLTTVSIYSSLLSFPTISQAEGRASAGFAITDSNGDGATLTPLGAGAYLTQYNGFVPTGATFSETLDAFSAPMFQSANNDTNVPATGYNAIPVPVSDISTQIEFTLTAHDFATGTSTFEVVPEPSAVLLLVLGGFALARRRS